MRELRGSQPLYSFAQRLGLSYTFVREMERGNRLPSDQVVLEIATRLGVDPGELAFAVYCDRSPILAAYLRSRGVEPQHPAEPPSLIRQARDPDQAGTAEGPAS